MNFDHFQSLPDFHTPFILNDESYDHSVLVGEFAHRFHDGFEGKPGQLSSMTGYAMGQAGLIGYQPPLTVDNALSYGGFPPTPYDHHPLLHPGNAQEPDLKYGTGSDDQSEKSFEHGPAMFVESQAPRGVDMRAFVAHQRAASTDFFNNSRKRKISNEDEYELPMQKKAMLAQVHLQNPNGEYYDLSGQTSPFSPFMPTPTGSTGIPACAPNGASPRPGHHYSTSTASQVSLAAPSPHTPAFSPSFTAVKSEQSPGGPLTPIPRPTTSSPLKSSIPKLVRTSTMQQSPPTVYPNVTTAHQPPTFNPYAMSTLKANLRLKGDLDTMKDDWTEEEKESRRRLVVFERHQSNSTIHAEFRAVSPQDRQASSICISCIWWKEQNEFYVTSVDTIYLLESLVGVRFTVEEKNRIRRNLEGFRPMTVSKAKTDSEEFFKVIMGFPHPKPRNIEKDVKVFPWKILSTALKKIISKYSASYSSTAASLLTPNPSFHGDGMPDYHYPPSPHDDYIPASVNPYSGSHGMGYVQQQLPMRMPGPVLSAPPELQLQMPEYMPVYDVDGQYPYPGMMQAVQGTMAMPAHPMTAPVSRMPSWEYANFSDGSLVMTPQSAPPVAYPRAIETAEFMPTMHYQQR